MEILQQIGQNTVLVIGFYAWLVAQILKTMIFVIQTKSFDIGRLVGSGGMPSSHSALVCSMSTAVGRIYGLHSVEFAIAAILSMIVMYDAMGVRRAAGEQAKVLNQMATAFMDNIHKKSDAKYDDSFFQNKLKELLGHTPLEVLAGSILGIIMGYVVPIS